MPDAYVKYLSGGGYQKVADYDYVFDARKQWESGYYRDSGFNPLIALPETASFDAQFKGVDKVIIGNAGNVDQYVGGGTMASFSGDAVTPETVTGFTSFLPDEVSHESLRQTAWLETTLTFCANSDTSVAFTADNTTDTLTATAHGLAGKRVVLSATTSLPIGLFANQLYYIINPTANTFQLSLAQNGSAVNFTSNGSGTLTATVVDTIAEFPWKSIQGWSNTAPTR